MSGEQPFNPEEEQSVEKKEVKWIPPEDLDSSFEMMPEILSTVLENYSKEELKERPLGAQDILNIIIGSEAIDVPGTWEECTTEQQTQIIRALEETIKDRDNLIIVNTPDGPEITSS